MSQGKLSLTLGTLQFSGEGDEKWLSTELAKVFEQINKLNLAKAVNPAEDTAAAEKANSSNSEFKDSLATHIKAKNGEANQNNRFLATADWLRRKGTRELTTASVSKALSSNQQKRLSNPADCLNQNVKKGLIEKSGNGFFITPEGLTTLGYQ